MDINKCIDLHNGILKHGWLASGKTNEDFDEQCKTWFDHYGTEAEEVRDRLSPDLIAFLEGAYVAHDSYSFFYYVRGLHDPQSLFEAAEPLNSVWSDEGEHNFVLLYAMHLFGSHPVGLAFDQRDSSAILCETLDDCGIICNGRIQWHYLDTVLEAWRALIEDGKIIATANGGENEPWSLVPYSQQTLQDTVDAFNSLVDEIESRMPGSARRKTLDHSLLEDEDFGPDARREGFSYEFARAAKLPRFKFIAPGLQIPRGCQMEAPFASLRGITQTEEGHVPSDHFKTLPLLLFRATEGDAICMAPAPNESCPFGWPFTLVDQYPAGLYLSCTDPSYNNAFEDECTLVLPHEIGENGHARTSDGAIFGENQENSDEDVEAQNTFADVYQMGQHPFVVGHRVQLVQILEHWLEMVRSGEWEVDENGVVGGIDEWRKVDTKEHWMKYILPFT